MIPVLIGAALWGVSNMAEAENNIDRARSINKQAAAIADAANDKTKAAHSSMIGVLKRLGKTKMNLMTGNINDVADIMSNIYRNFKINRDTQGLRELEEGGIDEFMLSEMTELSDRAIEIASTREFASADTGSFCAVGALGGAVLGAGIAAPAMLIYSFMKSDEAEAALYEAQSRLDEARYYEQCCKNICALFQALETRGNQIDNLLNRLNNYFNPAVNQLNEVKFRRRYDFRNYSPEEKALVFYTWQIAKTTKIIVDTSLMREDWSLNPDIERPLEIGNKTLALLSS